MSTVWCPRVPPQVLSAVQAVTWPTVRSTVEEQRKATQRGWGALKSRNWSIKHVRQSVYTVYFIHFIQIIFLNLAFILLITFLETNPGLWVYFQHSRLILCIGNKQFSYVSSRNSLDSLFIPYSIWKPCKNPLSLVRELKYFTLNTDAYCVINNV